MRWKTVALSLLGLSLSFSAAAAPPPTVPRGPEYRINTNPDTSHFSPSIAAFPDGGFVVVWYGDGNRARFLDAQGRPRREVPLAVYGGLPEQVVADRDGSFLVTWVAITPSSSAQGIFVRRFNRDGTPRGKRIRVSNLSTSDRRNPLISIAPNGRFAVAWEADVRIAGDGTYTNAVGRIFAANGTPLTSEILLDEGEPASAAGDDAIDVYPTGLALKPDGTLVAQIQSTEGGGCRRSFLRQRSPGGELSDLIGLGSLLCNTAGQSPGSLALRPNGGVIAAWTDYEIQAQRFGPDLTEQGDWFGVSDEDVYLEDSPAIAVQPGGRFVIVWTEEDRDGDGEGIFGRSFAASGTPRTGDYQINVTTEGDQLDPVVAASARGSVVVAVWVQQLEENGRSDIFARVLAPQP